MKWKFCMFALVCLGINVKAEAEETRNQQINRRIRRLEKAVEALSEDVNQNGDDLRTLETDLATLGIDLENLGSELGDLSTVVTRNEANLETFGSDLGTLGTDLESLDSELEGVKDSIENGNGNGPSAPATQMKKVAYCASSYLWNTVGDVSYNYMIAELNEYDKDVFSLDGYFTAPVKGVYQVVASADYAKSETGGGYNLINMAINGVVVDSLSTSYIDVPNKIWDPFTGLRLVELEEGDVLHLVYDHQSFYYAAELVLGLSNFKFCVSLYGETA